MWFSCALVKVYQIWKILVIQLSLHYKIVRLSIWTERSTVVWLIVTQHLICINLSTFLRWHFVFAGAYFTIYLFCLIYAIRFQSVLSQSSICVLKFNVSRRNVDKLSLSDVPMESPMMIWQYMSVECIHFEFACSQRIIAVLGCLNKNRRHCFCRSLFHNIFVLPDLCH
jgi:hypothetical protein